MEVTSIQNGIIIDHVPAGTSLKVLEYLKIDPAKTKLALIMNADSHMYGTKDIIKIDRITTEGPDGKPEVISASRVRKLLDEQGVTDEVLSLVPECTAKYLKESFK